ncbi:MAG: family 43 glycosylhydrolase, partial [Clostridia bacterium]|nr:family 43 glycosylhydrolase [Clostridia bacterium]
FCILLTGVIMILSMSCTAYAYDDYPYNTKEIRVRDPFVLVYGGKYYMYGTGLAGWGYGCCVSEDLENWSAPSAVFTPDKSFDSDGCWWAPECHYYNGSFYLFATYRSIKRGKRGTAVFIADSPLGPFELLSDGHVTPKDRDCIDGTLYVDEDNQPWIVYVGEWTSNEDGVGDMCTAKLSSDLSAIISEPKTVFRGTDAKWANGFITDGPFVYKTKTGRLLMLWSNFSEKGYAVGIAYSDNGRIDGKWKHKRFSLYSKNHFHSLDGGHAMVFNDLDGNLLMAIHSPNTASENIFESAVFIPVVDMGFTLKTADGPDFYNKLLEFLSLIIVKVSKKQTPGYRKICTLYFLA